MGLETAAGLAIAGAAGSISHEAARKQSSVARAQQESVRAAAKVEERRAGQRADVERLRESRAAQDLRGRLKVAAANAGIGLGGSTAALLRQVDVDEALNRELVAANEANVISATRAGARARVSQLGAGIRNPLLEGLAGGIGGFDAGLQLGEGIERILR